MRLAVVGSRNVDENFIYKYLSEHIPDNIDEIVSGGAKGTDSVAEKFAQDKNIKLTLFLPEYNRYKKGAPIKRNAHIAEYADCAFIFWDGASKGTQNIMNCFVQKNKNFRLIYI